QLNLDSGFLPIGIAKRPSVKQITFGPVITPPAGFYLHYMKFLRMKIPGVTIGPRHRLDQKVGVPKVDIHHGVEVDLTEPKLTDRAPAFRSSRCEIIVYHTKILQYLIKKQPMVVC